MFFIKTYDVLIDMRVYVRMHERDSRSIHPSNRHARFPAPPVLSGIMFHAADCSDGSEWLIGLFFSREPSISGIPS